MLGCSKNLFPACKSELPPAPFFLVFFQICTFREWIVTCYIDSDITHSSGQVHLYIYFEIQWESKPCCLLTQLPPTLVSSGETTFLAIGYDAPLVSSGLVARRETAAAVMLALRSESPLVTPSVLQSFVVRYSTALVKRWGLDGDYDKWRKPVRGDNSPEVLQQCRLTDSSAAHYLEFQSY